MLTIQKKQSINENVEKNNRFLRFVLPATIDFTINQNDMEKFYTYQDYKQDVQLGLKEKDIITKLENMIEDMAMQKMHQIDQQLQDTDIQLQKIPNLKTAQFYRFSFGMLLKDYSESYDMEQESLINQTVQN